MAHIYNNALVKPTNFCSNASLMNDILRPRKETEFIL